MKQIKEGATLSLDSFYEENAFEFEDPTDNQCETILTAMLFEYLIGSIRSLNSQGKNQFSIFNPTTFF